MTITANLADGRKLNFPDGTDPAVIQSTVKKVMGVGPAAVGGPPAIGAAAPAPTTPAAPTEGARRISQFARPLLQGAGATAGALLGGGIGLAGGPAAPGTVPGGAIAGGGIGFAIGDELADLLDQSMGLREQRPLVIELAESAGDIALGATFEMGGQAIVPAARLAGKAALLVPGVKPVLRTVQETAAKIKKAIPLTKKGTTEKAADILIANTNNGPLIAQNIDEARILEETIPGLKFSRGQLTDDPGVIKFERATAREPGEFAAQQAEIKAKNTKAITDFVESKKGPGGIADVTQPLARQQQATEGGVTAATGALEREAAGLAEGASPVEAGKAIRAEAVAGKSAAREKAGELFREVPEATIEAKSLADKAAELQQPFTKFEAEGNIPDILDRVVGALDETGGKVSLDDLQGLRSELAEQIRDIRGSADPNNRKLVRLSGLMDEVENILGLAGEEGSKLKTATTFFKKEVIDKFKKGAVGDILRGGNKVENAQIASRFFKPGPAGEQAALEFTAALGKNPAAKEALEDFIKQDLLAKVVNPRTGEMGNTALRHWLARHKLALDKLGLKDKFNSVSKATKALEDARAVKTGFDKSAASKLLNADVDTAIKSAFSTGPKGAAARQLMKQVGDDPAAIAGLQNATIDHIISTAETTAVDAFQNPILSVAQMDRVMKTFKPAMDVIFKGAPEKLKALEQTRTALRTLQRTATSPLGGGSDTAENILTSIAKQRGFSGSRLVNIVRAFVAPLKNLSDNQVNAVINRALIDPDFAFTLMASAGGKLPEQAVARRMNQHLATMGLVITAKQKEQKRTQNE